MKSDKALKQDVEAELDWEPQVNAARIGVAAKNGVVSLTGYVSSFAEKYAAERTAKRVYGVNAVADELGDEIAWKCSAHRRGHCGSMHSSA